MTAACQTQFQLMLMDDGKLTIDQFHIKALWELKSEKQVPGFSYMGVYNPDTEELVFDACLDGDYSGRRLPHFVLCILSKGEEYPLRPTNIEVVRNTFPLDRSGPIFEEVKFPASPTSLFDGIREINANTPKKQQPQSPLQPPSRPFVTPPPASAPMALSDDILEPQLKPSSSFSKHMTSSFQLNSATTPDQVKSANGRRVLKRQRETESLTPQMRSSRALFTF